MRKIIASISAVILAAGFLAYNALPANAAESDRHITGNGVGTATVTPDAVRFYASVTFVAKTSKEALASTSATANTVRTTLRGKGIATKDIKTSSVTTYPEYNYTQEKGSELIGYRATQSFTVVIRKAESAGEVIEAVVDAGGDAVQVNGISPFLIEGAAATQKAREAAVADAKLRANSYAKLLGETLGKVQHMTENSAPSYVFPMLGAEKMAADGLQMDLGETEVTVNITVRWALR